MVSHSDFDTVGMELQQVRDSLELFHKRVQGVDTPGWEGTKSALSMARRNVVAAIRSLEEARSFTPDHWRKENADDGR